MPNFDGTGPRGQGPKTGRGMGRCDDNDQENKDQEKKAPEQDKKDSSKEEK